MKIRTCTNGPRADVYPTAGWFRQTPHLAVCPLTISAAAADAIIPGLTAFLPRKGNSMPCSCGDDSGFSSLLNISKLRQSNSRAQALMAGQASEERIVRIGGHLAHATAVDNGQRGCFTIPFLGVPVQLCWEIVHFEVSDQVVDVQIKITVSVAGTEFLSTTVVFHCDGVTKPDTCKVSLQAPGPQAAAAASPFSIGCDWGCLGTCAPGCISCGTDYLCWAGCAGSCILKCCHL